MLGKKPGKTAGPAALAGPEVLVLEYFPTASFGRASWDRSISLKTRLDGHKIAPVDDALMTARAMIGHHLMALSISV
jgi:hypothetical protein